MNGADYIARVRLSTRQDETLARPGDTCERVPASSLPWLAEQNLIVPRPRPTDQPRRVLTVDDREGEA